MMNDPLMTPFTLKDLTLRNRIVSTSHEPAYSEDGLPKDRYRAYHVAKARGGVGLTMIGGSALVSRESAPAFGNLQLWKEESEPLLRRLATEVHDEGAAVMIQLTHLGHRTSNYVDDWLPAISVDNVREPAHRAFAKAAEEWDLDRVLGDFVRAAQMCQAAGLDGIELNLYGHFLDAFWTPYWNHRDDEYGGTYENRVRYPLRVIRAIREAVGPGFVVGARMTFDELREGGLETGEALRIADDITVAGIDFISLIKGSIATDADLARAIPPMSTPTAPHLEFAGEVKRKLSVPVMHAARITDVETARHAIAEGLLDLVGMTRALMADPELPNKVRTGQTDRIRPCVGASMCIDGIYQSGAAYCIHNPSTGRELELPHQVARTGTPKRIAVVGAGPAGLESARVLAERGHDVQLFEAADKVGGQLSLASLAPRRRDLRGIIDWRVEELARLGVPISLNAYVDADELRAQSWDVVIVATGGTPAAPRIPGADLVLDTWDVLSGARRPGGHVMVYDDHGGNQTLDAVEALVTHGAKVELVTPERGISPDVGGITAAGYFHELAKHGVTVTILRRLRAVTRSGRGVEVELGIDGFDFRESRTFDAVVAEMGTEPVTELYDELVPLSTNHGTVDLAALLAGQPQEVARNDAGSFRLYRVGDAVSSRNVHAAILDAARLCRAV
ncbi:2,4-dienoyl-CoA reductase-like NADH-dependent reductase (Old Yellow Enzyme family)/thioredoxin reductase [Kibdelosporangium banguiense]|uniref:2,4-dienoyl-CoA reductase-like NADH-dependent reductase (Old Yellow Enzyme family)/thioredoxin reductase n=1 Tax=Kibdelosporangium banguiense TaxID=1365924 RepID=A0ABS4TR81_9PSEU|nr:FAD-dependent oxidoreductase [Kibdelosporangium banguiense]MBP2326923.1 2,4-dienoyl-CoA reductase-like NADH-dependent reductase (Old Yellow Enzyme family)/thioredoxin reductase [Kibdelosporangium banguiense]